MLTPVMVDVNVTTLFDAPNPSGSLQWCGNLPVRATRALQDAGFDARRLLDVERID